MCEDTCISSVDRAKTTLKEWKATLKILDHRETITGIKLHGISSSDCPLKAGLL